MKRLLTYKFPIAAVALLSALTLSCSHEPSIEQTDPNGTDVAEWNDSTISGDAVMTEMAFTIGNSMVVNKENTTRSTTNYDGTGTFSENDLIAIAIKRNNVETVKLYKVTSDGSLEYAGGDNQPFTWQTSTETVSIRAWSYGTNATLSYILTAPETIDFNLETDQQTNGYRELLYCKAADKTYSTSPITLNFYHQLTRLIINITHDKTGTLSVNSTSIGSNTFPIKASFSVPTGSSNVGTWTTKATYGTITPKSEETQSGQQRTYSAVIFPSTYAKDTPIFTLTNSDGNYVYNVTDASGQTLAAGNQYNYTITIKDDITKNPLWWVAQYNMAQNKTSFVTEHSTTDQYVFNFTDAQGANISFYHVPTLNELSSIIPSHVTTGAGINIYALTNTLANPYEFSEIACDINGTSVAASKSVFGKNAYNDYYAVRFVNTPYASAWHYKHVSSPCNGVLIESYLLSGVTTLIEAKNILKNLASSPTFTGSLDAATANQTPESNMVTTKCFVQRFLPACGYLDGGSGVASVEKGYCFNYWSSTADGSNGHTWHFYFRIENRLQKGGYSQTYGSSVRLFKGGYQALSTAVAGDIGKVVCSNAHIHQTVSDVTCGGVASGMIAYISSQGHGIAIALTDVLNSSGTEGTATMTWSAANTGSGKYVRARPTSYSGVSAWRLISKSDYDNMIGSSGCQTPTNLRDMKGRQSTSCGGTAMGTGSHGDYWSSTVYSSGYYYYYRVSNGTWHNAAYTATDGYARACFTF